MPQAFIFGETRYENLTGRHTNIHSPGRYRYDVVEVPGGEIVCVASLYHALIVNDIGEVFAIGRNRNNCTGVTTTQDPLTKLTKVTALENERVVGVACGDVHSLFLTAQNELYTCGGNDYYQLGNNGSEHHMQEINIQKHIGDGRITHISSGYYFSCCVVNKKDLWVWGSNYDNQLGVSGDNKIGITHSKSFNHNSPVKLLQTGSNNIIIVTEDNCLFTCGYNESGQNANNDRTNVKSFIQIKSPGIIKQISSRFMHLLLLLENGQLWSCGKNSYNQVDNTGADQLVLTQMEYAKSVRTYKCAAASLSTMIITENNTVYCVGQNNKDFYGTLAMPNSQLSEWVLPPELTNILTQKSNELEISAGCDIHVAYAKRKRDIGIGHRMWKQVVYYDAEKTTSDLVFLLQGR